MWRVYKITVTLYAAMIMGTDLFCCDCVVTVILPVILPVCCGNVELLIIMDKHENNVLRPLACSGMYRTGKKHTHTMHIVLHYIAL